MPKEPYLLGLVRIRLANLKSDPMKHIQTTKVDRLVEGFRKFGCGNDINKHAIPALMDRARFRDALAQAGIQSFSLCDGEEGSQPLSLPETEKLAILYGEHRLEAARRHLPADNRWWLVKVYDRSRFHKIHGNQTW